RRLAFATFGGSKSVPARRRNSHLRRAHDGQAGRAPRNCARRFGRRSAPSLPFAFHYQIAEHCAMAFDLKEIVAARLGENYQLHERHVNPTLVAAQRVIGFDKVYARAEGAYLYDMDNQPYLDFLSGYSVFNIGRNHPVV